MSKFPETVFILGAGASFPGGAPLMGTFIDAARRLQPDTKGSIRHDFDLVLKGISRLQIVHSKAQLDLNNLEAVFGAFEMARLFDSSIGDMAADEVAQLADAMRTMIVHTIEETLRFQFKKKQNEPYVNKQSLRLEPPGPYGEFTKAVIEAFRPAIITFNYDLGIDYALKKVELQPNYHLSKDSEGAVPLLKLHGSLNWVRCSKCKTLHAAPLDTPEINDGSTYFRYRISEDQLRKASACCDTSDVIRPTIVPPTWSKGEHHHTIATVWTAAARYLSKARNIVVIGYSLPDSDMFFRFLYALGTIGDHPLNRFVVMDPDPDAAKRFKSLLGVAAAQRFVPLQMPFDNVYLNHIIEAIK